MKLLPIAAALSTALLTPNLYADETTPLEFNGYMRGGVGLSNEGGSNSKWEVSKVGRLGNENDLYGEFGFRKEVYAEDDVSFLVDRWYVRARCTLDRNNGFPGVKSRQQSSCERLFQ